MDVIKVVLQEGPGQGASYFIPGHRPEHYSDVLLLDAARLIESHLQVSVRERRKGGRGYTTLTSGGRIIARSF